MDDPRKVILRPIVTEKTTFLSERETEAAYVFQVHAGCSKIEIRQALETIFGVKVKSVKTMWRRGKQRQTRRGATTRLPDVKRAIVTLKEGYKIELR